MFRFLIVFLACSCPSLLLAGSPKETLAEFKAAIKQKKGQKAARLLSKETVETYERYRKAALTTPEEKLERLPTPEVIGLVSFRHHFTKKELLENTGASLLEKAVTLDPATIKSLEGITLDEVTYEKDKATATLNRNGKSIADVRMVFRKQDGIWKWDVDHYSNQAADHFEKLRKKQDLSKAEFALHLLRVQYGDKVSAEITKGPVAD